jgi:cupin fold WbuC family metalloprotein
MPMKLRKVSEEVFVSQAAVLATGAGDLDFLKEQARRSPKKRARVCAHTDAQSTLHEMVIVLDRDAYVRPHLQDAKPKSYHVIEGELDLFVFNEDGTVRDIVHLGDRASGKPFYYRYVADVFHTPVTVSRYVMFVETTTGPFVRQTNTPPTWAPEENDPQAVAAYLNRLRSIAITWQSK